MTVDTYKEIYGDDVLRDMWVLAASYLSFPLLQFLSWTDSRITSLPFFHCFYDLRDTQLCFLGL